MAAVGGVSALGSLLRGLAEDAAPLYEAKLLVTGEGSVGKSWALAALQGKDPRKSVGRQTTYGIDRGSLALPHPAVEGATITFNTWDFGGQQVYRVTNLSRAGSGSTNAAISCSPNHPARRWRRGRPPRTGSAMDQDAFDAYLTDRYDDQVTPC